MTNVDLTRAIVAAFRADDAQTIREGLSAFTADDWSDSSGWLDVSGLELYLFGRLMKLGIVEVLPSGVLHGMERRYADNKVRMAGMFSEFIRVEQAFRQARLMYCNVLGFALARVCYPDTALRRQLSLDFIALHSELPIFGEILRDLGYVPFTTSEQFWEWHPASDVSQEQADIYASIARRSVRMHYPMANLEGVERAAYEMLTRRAPQVWNGYTFDAPTPSEHFICLGLRMHGVLGFEWARLAHLLELKAAMEYWRHDDGFWDEVVRRGVEHPVRPMTVATSVLAATKIFGGEIPPPLEEWVSTQVDPAVRRWSEKHGWDSLLTEFPGTTLFSLIGVPPAYTSESNHSS